MLREVEERSRDIACAVSQEEDGVGDDLLRMTCKSFSVFDSGLSSWEEKRTRSIGNLHTKDQDEGRIVWARQIVAHQSTNLLVLRNEPQPKGTSNVRAQENQNEQASAILEAVVQIHANQNRNGNEDAVWNLGGVNTTGTNSGRGRHVKTYLHQRRDESGKSKALNDNGAKVGDSTVGDVAWTG